MDLDTTRFAKVWLRQLRQLRSRLRSARPDADGALVRRALALYETYYQAHSELARTDPIRVYTAPWATELERAAHWIGGWRPTALIQLLYSECSLRFEAQLPNLLLGVRSGDLGDLDSEQLSRIDELQRRTIREEVEVGEGMAEVQEGVVEPFPVSDSDLEAKLAELGRVMMRADELRLRTLRDVLEILKPVQAVDLLVAAADLEIGTHELGLDHEQGRFYI